MSDYTTKKKVEVLDDVKRMGNYLTAKLCNIRKCYFELSKAARKHNITRQTIYNNPSAKLWVS